MRAIKAQIQSGFVTIMRDLEDVNERSYVRFIAADLAEMDPVYHSDSLAVVWKQLYQLVDSYCNSK